MCYVLKCKVSYKIRKTYVFYPVAPQFISGIHIEIAEFLHRTLKHSKLQIKLESYKMTHKIRHTHTHTHK